MNNQEGEGNSRLGQQGKQKGKDSGESDNPEGDSNNQDDHPWEAQVGWLYMGHGEWDQLEGVRKVKGQRTNIQYEPQWIQQWLAKYDTDIRRHNKVRRLGYPNRWGAQVEVKSRWNLEIMQHWLQDYEDKEVVEWIRYGWPTGRLPTLPPPHISDKNHKGATQFPEQMIKYI